MNKFLHFWLYCIGFLHIATGILICFFIRFDSNNSYINYLYSTLNIVLAPSNAAHSELIPTLLKLFGPAIMGWGILFTSLIYCLSSVSINKQTFRTLKSAGILSALSWYGLDSLLAWQAGLNLHIGFNVLIIMIITLPLIFLKEDENSGSLRKPYST